MLDQLFGVLHFFGQRRIFLCLVADSCKLQAERSQRLSRAIVQFSCYVPSLGILRLQESPRKLTQFRVSLLKFLSTELHLGVERIRQCSITFFALTQLSLNSLTLGDVPGNFRRSDNLSRWRPEQAKLSVKYRAVSCPCAYEWCRSVRFDRLS